MEYTLEEIRDTILKRIQKMRDGDADGDLRSLVQFIEGVFEDYRDGCSCENPKLITVHENDETFFPRIGCLKCNKWYGKPRLRNP
jgi:hypothetical protein